MAKSQEKRQTNNKMQHTKLSQPGQSKRLDSEKQYNSYPALRIREVTDQRKEWTKSALAEQIGVKIQTVSQWANGISLPNAAQIIALANTLDSSTDWLLGLSEIRTTNPDIQNACIVTGLSEKSITVLHTMFSEYVTLSEKMEAMGIPREAILSSQTALDQPSEMLGRSNISNYKFFSLLLEYGVFEKLLILMHNFCEAYDIEASIYEYISPESGFSEICITDTESGKENIFSVRDSNSAGSLKKEMNERAERLNLLEYVLNLPEELKHIVDQESTKG